MKHLKLFDIETGPDETRARAIMPAFDPAEVKCGNLGPEKAAIKIAEAKESHEADWLDKAALRPETGRVIAIGIRHDGVETLLHLNDATAPSNPDPANSERVVITTFWDRMQNALAKDGKRWAGWNIYDFDLPFLIIRSRILGIPVPSNLRNGRYFDDRQLIDLMNEWLCGRQKSNVKCSLDYVAKAFGVGQKNGDGKDFAALYARDPAAALQYLSNDLALLEGVAGKFGYV